MSNDGCVLIDEASAVLLAAEGQEQLSPVRSSVLELIRAYAWLRNSARLQLRMQLLHQRKCSLVKLRAPDISAKAVMELGAVGSFFESIHLAHRLPAFGFLEVACDPKVDWISGNSAAILYLRRQDHDRARGYCRGLIAAPR